MNGLKIHTELTRRALVGFIRNEVRKIGFESVVLGLSGGVDSALSALLAAEALGPDKVLGVMMPYKTSAPDSLEDARAVVRVSGIRSRVVDITPAIDAYFDPRPEAGALRRGNKMARERMSVLYDLSVEMKALALGTSNKTELLLGYGTLFGDMASALNPIGDLYKTQVWQLAAAMGAPESVVSKKPSADLWEGQTDEGELGFSYESADRILYRLVDLRWPIERLVEEGFDEALVRRISGMVRMSQFKRKPPIIAKLSGRTIDRDFLYSRDWGM